MLHISGILDLLKDLNVLLHISSLKYAKFVPRFIPIEVWKSAHHFWACVCESFIWFIEHALLGTLSVSVLTQN